MIDQTPIIDCTDFQILRYTKSKELFITKRKTKPKSVIKGDNEKKG
jgi:hypothetical protein